MQDSQKTPQPQVQQPAQPVAEAQPKVDVTPDGKVTEIHQKGKYKVEVIREQAIKDGMRTLLQDGVMKVLKGDTDLKMVRTVCIK